MLQISTKWILKRLIRHGRKAESHKHFAEFKEELFFGFFFQELYRKDCNLAAQLLQCSKNYDRAHKLSEVMWPNFLNIQWYKYCMENWLFCMCQVQNLSALKALFPPHTLLEATGGLMHLLVLCAVEGGAGKTTARGGTLRYFLPPKPLLSSRIGLHWLPVKQRF